MAWFLVYWATAVATATPVLILIAFAVWGRPTSGLEFICIAGSMGLAAAAVIALRSLRTASLVAIVAVMAGWMYWGSALWAAFSNIRRGGAYPLQSFIPVAALFCTTCFAVVGFIRSWSGSRDLPAPKLLKVLAIALGILMIVPLCVVNPNRTPIDFFEMRKVVSVPMRSSKRTDVYAQPNQYVLEYDRQVGRCGTEFWGHPELGRYLESLGAKRVPVTYEVFYDNNGEAISANFMRVGDWKRSSFSDNAGSLFSDNEGSLSRGGLTTGPGLPPIVSRNPQDCFDKMPPKAD